MLRTGRQMGREANGSGGKSNGWPKLPGGKKAGRQKGQEAKGPGGKRAWRQKSQEVKGPGGKRARRNFPSIAVMCRFSKTFQTLIVP